MGNRQQFNWSDKTVKKLTAQEMAFAACEALKMAYDNGESNGGSVDWSEVDDAFTLAVSALKRRREELLVEGKAESEAESEAADKRP